MCVCVSVFIFLFGTVVAMGEPYLSSAMDGRSAVINFCIPVIVPQRKVKVLIIHQEGNLSGELSSEEGNQEAAFEVSK